MAAALQGDGWRKRHDGVKMRLFGLMRWAGVEADCEVFNLFSGLIPQQGLSRLEKVKVLCQTFAFGCQWWLRGDEVMESWC